MIGEIVYWVVGIAVMGLVWSLRFTAPSLLKKHAKEKAAKTRLTSGPVTAAERTDHSLSDSQSASLESFGLTVSLAAVVTGAAVAGVVGVGLKNNVVLFFCAVSALLIVSCIRSAAKYFSVAVRRAQLIDKLRCEHRQWDPGLKFPSVIVIHSDSCAESVQLFDVITQACYRSGLAVLQYASFDWPRYGSTQISTTGNVWTLPSANPAVVERAKAAVWLDLGTETPSATMELKEAQRLEMPLIKVSHPHDSQSFIVSLGNRCRTIEDTNETVNLLVAMLDEVVSQ